MSFLITLMATINPKSGRPITVGGRIWRKLVHDEVIKGDIVAPVHELYCADSKEEAGCAKKILARQKPPLKNQYLKTDNTGKRVIIARKPLSSEQIQKYMNKCTLKAYHAHRDELGDMAEEKVNDFLSEKILQMMLTDGKVEREDFARFMVKENESESESESGDESDSE